MLLAESLNFDAFMELVALEMEAVEVIPMNVDLSLLQLMSLLQQGVSCAGYLVLSQNHSPGRLKEESNVDLYLRIEGDRNENNAVRLMSVKVFHGRKPHYLPWMELYMIDHELVFPSGSAFRYFGSEVEKRLLSLISSCKDLPRLFIDYMNDIETRTELYKGVPPVLTRLGFLLFSMGYTWFKDWYYPEGFKEGGVKLQAERALTDEQRQSQLQRLKSEVQQFLRIVDEKNLSVNFTLLKKRADVVLST